MSHGAPATIGRYELHEQLAQGGMATVHVGRLRGAHGFAKTVAIKRLHPHLAKDPDFSAMFLDEARVAARIQHQNVVSTIDVVALDGEMFLVMEYVDGESLSRLLRTTRERGGSVDPRIAVAIVSGVLHGLHAAHEAKNERGEPLHIVHRDVSPQNVLVGRDGSARVLDFGVAKAAGKLHTTREGSLKGKVAYMPPEQLRSEPLDRRADVYSAAVVLWETLAARKLFSGENEAALLEQILFGTIEPPSKVTPGVPVELDAIVLKGLERDREKRYQTAQEMALALEGALQPALASSVSEWVKKVAAETLAARAARVADIESSSDISGLIQATAQDETKAAADVSGALAAISASSARIVVDPANSQVSSISVARGPTPQSRRPVIGLTIALALMAGLVLVLLVVRPWSSTVPSTPSSAAASATATTPPVAVPSTATASAPAVSASASPTASVAASSSALAVRPKPSARPTGTAATAASSDDCKVPYTVDANGTMIYKRQCL